MVKKASAAIALFVVILLASGAYAASTGGGDLTGEAGKISLGVTYDQVFNRDLVSKAGKGAVGNNDVAYPDGDHSIANFKAQTNSVLAKGTVGIHKKIDLFVKVGLAKIRYKYIYGSNSQSTPQVTEEFKGDYGLAYGAGMTGNIMESSEGVKLTVTAQYMQYKSKGMYKEGGKDLTTLGSGITSYKSTTTAKEMGLALILRKDFEAFAIYGGARYTKLKLQNKTLIEVPGATYTRIERAQSDRNNGFGIFLGSEFKITDSIYADAEVRHFDETAATVTANYRF